MLRRSTRPHAAPGRHPGGLAPLSATPRPGLQAPSPGPRLPQRPSEHIRTSANTAKGASETTTQPGCVPHRPRRQEQQQQQQPQQQQPNAAGDSVGAATSPDAGRQPTPTTAQVPTARHGAQGRSSLMHASYTPASSSSSSSSSSPSAAASPPLSISSPSPLPLPGRRASRRRMLAGGVAAAAAAAASGWVSLGPPLPPGLHGPAGPRAVAAEEQLGAAEAFCLVAPELGGSGGGVGGAVGPAGLRRFASLAEAVAACPAGGVVLVAAGRYTERLVLSRPMTVRAWPKGARVEVVWETREPYQSTLQIDGGGGGGDGDLLLEGLTVRHSSKSVANNYGVYIRSGRPALVDCDISTATGAGVGVEGASPQILGCRIHDCARQGLAIFGPTAPDLDLDPAVDPGLLYGMSGGVVRGCDVYGNALDGVLVRNGASPDLLDNLIHNNGGWGVNLQDCAGRYEGNTVYDNSRGALAVSALFELDPGDIAGINSLRGLLRRL